MKTVIYIVSTGYAGSTLLEMVLGMNPGVVNTGEIYKLSSRKSCNCLTSVQDCPFWSVVLQNLRKKLDDPELLFCNYYLTAVRAKKSFRRNFPSIHDLFIAGSSPRSRWLFEALSAEVSTFAKQARRASLLFEVIKSCENAKIIIDSSKDPVLMKHLYCEMPDELKIIHLARDGRAVTSSAVKNFDRDGATYPSDSETDRPTVAVAAKWWKTRNRNIDLALLRIPKTKRLRLKYEDICQQPGQTAETLSNFLGLPIQVPSEFTPSLSHSIAGNPMRDTKATLKVKLDETWRDRLSEEDLAIFESIAGPYNRRLGYI